MKEGRTKNLSKKDIGQINLKSLGNNFDFLPLNVKENTHISVITKIYTLYL